MIILIIIDRLSSRHCRRNSQHPQCDRIKIQPADSIRVFVLYTSLGWVGEKPILANHLAHSKTRCGRSTGRYQSAGRPGGNGSRRRCAEGISSDFFLWWVCGVQKYVFSPAHLLIHTYKLINISIYYYVHNRPRERRDDDQVRNSFCTLYELLCWSRNRFNYILCVPIVAVITMWSVCQYF